MKEYKFLVVHPGELSAGIHSYTENVTVSNSGDVAEDYLNF